MNLSANPIQLPLDTSWSGLRQGIADCLGRAGQHRADAPANRQVELTEHPWTFHEEGLGNACEIPLAGHSAAKTVSDALAKTGPAGVEWKLDGIRAQIHKQGNDIRVLTRSLDDITDRVPEVVDLIRSLPATSAIFDGELIALYPDL